MKLKNLLLLLCLFLMIVKGFAQQNPYNEILVFFGDGISQDIKTINGRTVKGAKIGKDKLKQSLLSIGITDTLMESALPNFKEADTLHILQDGMRMKQANMTKLYKIKLPVGKKKDDVINYLKSLPEVIFAEQNGKASPNAIPADPLFLYQWGLNNNSYTGRDIHAKAAWDIYTGNPNNIIAIIDGGIQTTHEDLSAKIVGGDTGFGWDGHGIEMAGIASAQSNNILGISGVDWNAKILPKRIDNVDATGTYQAIIDAVNFSPNVFILNNSWGLTYPDNTPGLYSSLVRQAFAYAYKANRVSVTSMGNHQLTNQNTINYPAGFDNVIAVGATDNTDVIAPSSVQGNNIDVCAPGVNIMTTIANSYNNVPGGTSHAAAFVSGIASLLKGYNSNLSNDDIENIIKLSADKTGEMITKGENFSIKYGYGRVNAERALNYLRSPYTLVQQNATSGTVISTSNQSIMFLIAAAVGLPTSNYVVQKIEVQKTVPLPTNISKVVGAWGRGSFSTGWMGSTDHPNQNFGEGFCEIVPGSLTSTSMTLRTYVYQVWTLGGSLKGYYPSAPSNAVFAYSVLGLKTMTGSTQLCSQNTYSIDNLPTGSTVTWSAVPSNIVSFPTNGNPITVTKLNNGKVTLTATINSSLTIPMAISVGTPYYLGISGISNLNMWDVGYFQVLPGNGYYAYEGTLSLSDGVGLATSYGWSFVSSTTGKSVSWWPNGSSVDVAMKTSNTDLTLKCTATNSCGSYTQYYWFSTGAYLPLILTPNPSSTQVEISIADEAISTAGTLQPLTTEIVDNVSYSISVVDCYGYTVYSNTKTGKKFTISTSTFRNGVYAVLVSDGKNVYQKKLIVKH